MTHRNAPLTPEGRRRACLEVDRGRPICHVAAEFRIARQTLGKWHARWVAEGEVGLEDRSSRPCSSPRQTPVEVEDLIEKLRREHKVGPVQLAGKLRAHGHEVPISTIHRVLARRGINRLRDIAPDGEDLREPVRRYEWARPGDMVHVDVKKVGRIPDGGGWRVHGRRPRLDDKSDETNLARGARFRRLTCSMGRMTCLVRPGSFALLDHRRVFQHIDIMCIIGDSTILQNSGRELGLEDER